MSRVPQLDRVGSAGLTDYLHAAAADARRHSPTHVCAAHFVGKFWVAGFEVGHDIAGDVS